MSNRTRKVISILCVLAFLCTLLPGAALAKSGKSRDKTAKSTTPQISVGGGAMYLSFDGGVTSSVWLSAGSSGTVELTLILSEDCGLSVSLNGGGVGLTVEEDLVRTCRYNVVAGQNYLLEITPNRNVTIGVRADKWTDSPEADLEDVVGEEADPEQESTAVAGQDDPSGETLTEADSNGQTGENPAEDDTDGQTGVTPAENDSDVQNGDDPEDTSSESVEEELSQETGEENASIASAETETTDDPQEAASETGETSQEATGDQVDQPSSNVELPEQEEPHDPAAESLENQENQDPEGITDQGSDEEQPTEGQEAEASASDTNQTEVQTGTENYPESGEGTLIMAQEDEEAPAEMQEPSEAALIETIAEPPYQEDSEEEEKDLAVQTEGTGGKLSPEEETEIPVPEQNEPEQNEAPAQQEPASSHEEGTPSQMESAEPQAGTESQTPTEPQAEPEPQIPSEPQTETKPQAETEFQSPAQPQAETGSLIPVQPEVETELQALAELQGNTAPQTAAQPQAETESQTLSEPQTETEVQNPAPAAEEILPPDRSATFEVTFDTDAPAFGDTAHFRAVLKGYDEVEYTLQWQYSLDDENWEDIPEATEPEMDLTVTRENHLYFWRIMVYVRLPESET